MLDKHITDYTLNWLADNGIARTLNLKEVDALEYNGYISIEAWRIYVYLWSTVSFRFSLREFQVKYRLAKLTAWYHAQLKEES